VSTKPIIPRERARQDVQDIIDHYLREAGPGVALGLIDELEQAYRLMAQHPGAGSPRYAFELQIADLRHLPLRRYPYLIFYVERPDHIDVWRLLHGTRDIPAWLAGMGPEEPAT